MHIYIYTQTNCFSKYLKRDFSSGFLPQRLLWGSSAIVILVFWEPVFPSVEGEDPTRAGVFIATPLHSPKLHPWALLLWKWE